MNYLGIDWGKSKIGFAIGSDEAKIASPFFVLRYKSLDEVKNKIKKFVEEEGIEAFVLGKPISLSGEEHLSESFEVFVQLLEGFKIKLKFEDERMSTKLAGAWQKEGSVKKDDDDLAAVAILQGYFDRMSKA